MSHLQQTEDRLVDTHCHVDLFPDPFALARTIDSQRVHTIAVTNAPSVFEHTERLARSSRFLHAAAGLHPELVATHAQELDRLWPFLERTRFIGEVGLDYTTANLDLRARQRAVFSKILEKCAGIGEKAITVHSRRAASDVIAAIGDRYPGIVILHWFSGTARELERAVQAGLFFSVNLAMLQSKKGRELIARMPKNRVLAESDGPFVRTVSGPADPGSIFQVTEWLASLWRVSRDEAVQIIARNFSI